MRPLRGQRRPCDRLHLSQKISALLLLCQTDAYAFRRRLSRRRAGVSVHRRPSVWRYLFRYLMAHKNYLVNTAAMWGVACVLPVLFGQMEARFILLVGMF